MPLPTNAEIDAACPPNGQPHSDLLNTVLKNLKGEIGTIPTDLADVRNFGALGENATADTAAFQAALATGRSVYVPETADGVFYRINTDLRVVNSFQGFAGGSLRSKIGLTAGARIIFGNSIVTAGAKDPAGRVAQNYMRNLRVECEPRDGPMILLEYTQHWSGRFLSLAPSSADATKRTGGITTKWSQWTDIDDTVIKVNGVSVHVILDQYPQDPEGHITLRDVKLLLSGPAVAGSQPTGILVERIVGRAAVGSAIREFNLFGGHIANLMSGGDAASLANTVGIGLKNELSGAIDTKLLLNGCLYGTLLDTLARGIDFATLAARDTSRVSLYGVKATACGIIGFGDDDTKQTMGLYGVDTEGTTGPSSFNGVGLFLYGPVTGMTNPISGGVMKSVLNYGGPPLRPGGRSWRQGEFAILAGSQSATVTHNLSEAPTTVTVQPSWPTFWWITVRDATTFSVRFSNPPAANDEFYWEARMASDRRSDTVPAGGAFDGVKAAGFTLGANGHDVIYNMTVAGTVTIPAASALGVIFRAFVMNSSGGNVVLNGPGTTNLTVAAGDLGFVYCSNGNVWATSGAHPVPVLLS